MFNLNDLGNMSKLAGEAKKMQAQQEVKQQEQIAVLNRIDDTLNAILAEIKKNNPSS